jgi:hypothetical protein
MVVRDVDAERRAVRVDPELRCEGDEETEDSARGELAAGGDDAVGEPRLEALPLGRERLLPVGLEQPREPLDEPFRILEERRCGPNGARSHSARLLQRQRPHLRVREHASPCRSPPAAVVVQRAKQLVRGYVGAERAQP